MKKINSGDSKSEGEILSDNEISEESFSLDFNDSKADFEKCWKKYIGLLIENGNLLLPSSKLTKRKFCDLLHRQIETCNQMFLIVSMADKKRFSEYFRLMNVSSGNRTDMFSMAKSLSNQQAPEKNKQKIRKNNEVDPSLNSQRDVEATKPRALSHSNDDEFGDLVCDESVNHKKHFPTRELKLNSVDYSQSFPDGSKLANGTRELRLGINKTDSFSFRVDDYSPDVNPKKTSGWYRESVFDMMNIEDQSKSEFFESQQEQQNFHSLKDSGFSFPNPGEHFRPLNKDSKQ